LGKLKDYINKLKNKKIAVVGAGVSNTPLIEALLVADIDTTIRDKRPHDELGETAALFEKQGAKLKLGDDYLCNLTEDVIFRTPGLMPSNPAIIGAVARGAILTSEMEAFFDICPCKKIGVTGSDGKTTTTSIIAELLKNAGETVHLGGNIGTPLLSKVDDMQPDDIAVIELSSFQLITMQKSPEIAVVTNLAPNHLDIHSDMDEYIMAKSNIFIHQKQTDRVIFNYDNDITMEYAKKAPVDEKIFFSRRERVENGIYLDNGTIYESVSNGLAAIMRADEIFLPGAHNIENYLAAFAAVSGMVSYDVMRRTASSFRGVEHRIEFVRELRGVKYYNDSIASSPSRTIAGIKALTMDEDGNWIKSGRRKIILVAGGKDKGVAFDELGGEIIARVKKLVLTGMAAGQISDAVTNASKQKTPDCSNALEVHQSDDFADAVQIASKLAEDGDIVLLSPACTSFDCFKNFEERGNTFKDIVNRLV